MSTPLLQTKLFRPPVRPNRIARPHLLAKLNSSLGHNQPAFLTKLTLIAAPAGSGKTSLAAEWLNQLTIEDESEIVNPLSSIRNSLAWLSLDENDNDPTQFLRYLVAACQQIDAGIGEGFVPLLQNSAPTNLMPLMAELVNDIANRPERIVLVLDDLHLLSETAVFQPLTFLIEHLPPNAHLLLISRSDPPLPLPRWRVRGWLNELGLSDLRFTPEETAAFFNDVMKLNLTSDDIARLDDQTEGWIASLQLAALSLQGQADPHQFVQTFTGDNRHVMDYLVSEVLERQPGYVRDFLLQTAVLRRLNVQLCNAITGQVGSQHILEALDSQNLFIIPLDDRRRWYRYHQLFADFLQTQLRQRTPEIIPELHRRACRWYVDHDLPEEAIEHALAGEDFAQAATLISQESYRVLWHDGRAKTLIRWSERLPQDKLFAQHRLALDSAWAHLFTGQLEQLDVYVNKLNRVASAEGEAAISPTLRGEIAALYGEDALNKGEISFALEKFEEADLLLPPTSQNARALMRQMQGYAYRLLGRVVEAKPVLQEAATLAQAIQNPSLQIFSLNDLAEAHLIAGERRLAEQQYERIFALRSAVLRPYSSSGSIAIVGMADVRREQNRLAEAMDLVREGMRLGKLSGYSAIERHGSTILARILQAQGDAEGAGAAMQVALNSARQTKRESLLARIEMLWARLHIVQEENAALQSWLQRMSQAKVAHQSVYQQHRERGTITAVLVALGDPDQALARLAHLLDEAAKHGWGHSRLELLVQQALACHMLGQTAVAQRALADAFGLAQPEGYLRLFLDWGARLVPLIQAAARRPETAVYARDILAHVDLPAGSTLDEAQNGGGNSALAEPLTERELEILQLMAAGLSNREIGEQLFIARGTVGKHTSNIFVKLEAPNRATAVLRAQQLRLIDD